MNYNSKNSKNSQSKVNLYQVDQKYRLWRKMKILKMLRWNQKAISTLKKLDGYSFSQGTVIRNKKILAIEGPGGTQKMLSRIKKNQGVLKGVLVKFPKKKQDLRVDLPTIGLKTLIQCKKKGLKGIALKCRQNVCLNKKEVINFANKHKIFIVSLWKKYLS